MLTCVLLTLLGSTGANLRSIGLALTAAVLPAAIYGGVILWLDRTEPESWDLRILTFLWGAVVAVFIALILNTTAETIFSLKYGSTSSDILTATIAAPLIEESAKGLLVLLVLWFTRKNIDGPLDGMVLGALVGLGFAMTENILYFGTAYREGGAAAVGTIFVVRCLINGLGHAVWTSFTGAAIGWSRSRHGKGVLRFVVPPLGWAMAVMGHAIWNLGGSLAIGLFAIVLTQFYLLPDWEAFIAAGILAGLPFTIPPILTAYIFARLGREQEERVIRTYLPIEVRLGTLSPAEAQIVADPDQRRDQIRECSRTRGKRAAKLQRAFDQTATRLAFFHYHALRGERPDADAVRRAEQQRWMVATLRWALSPTQSPRA